MFGHVNLIEWVLHIFVHTIGVIRLVCDKTRQVEFYNASALCSSTRQEHRGNAAHYNIGARAFCKKDINGNVMKWHVWMVHTIRTKMITSSNENINKWQYVMKEKKNLNGNN